MTLEETGRRTQAVSAIHDIVSALRTIAAGRIQGAQRALVASRNYREIILESIAVAAAGTQVSRLPNGKHRAPLLVVLTSEQPLCGGFNQNVLELAERRWQEIRQHPDAVLIGVGRRGLRLLSQRGIECHFTASAATSLAGVRDVIKNLARTIDHLIAVRKVSSLHVICNRYQSVSEQIPREEQILPLDLHSLSREGGSGTAPHFQHYLSRPELLAGLVREYSFITLYQLALDSFASEQASRLTAMDGATRNTERMLDELKELERRERQGAITAQVLEQIASRTALGHAKEPSEDSM